MAIIDAFGYIDVDKKKEFWETLSKEVSGKFKIVHNNSNIYEAFTLNFTYNDVNIKFTESDTKPLKVEFSHLSKNRCDILLSREEFIDRIVKKLGGNKEIQVGNNEFDDAYLVQGEDHDVLRKFVSKDIQKLMLKTDMYSLACKTDSKTNNLDVISTINRRIRSGNELKDVYKLACLITDKFKELNII